MTVAVPFNSHSLCVSQLRETATDNWAAQGRALQAERAAEQRRPQARSLTLCLLRMKREDFITSCRPRLHPSSLPPPKTPSPSFFPPSFPSTLPASSMFQGLSQPREGKQTAKKNHPIACLCCAVHREMSKDIKRQ